MLILRDILALSYMLTLEKLGNFSFLMSFISHDWPIALTLAVTVLCSIFIQAAEGAVFAIAPLIKRHMTGQIAGIVGAYGNAGAIFFIVLMSHVSASSFFVVLALCAAVSIWLLRYLDEPKEYMTEVLPDGTLVKIELN
ncbi:MAG: hypothetical protein Kow0065_19900 [Methylomicrobium sp.]